MMTNNFIDLSAKVNNASQAGLMAMNYNMHANPQFNMDSATMFFARELEYIKPRVYEVEYAQLSAFRLIPIDRTTPPGAQTVTVTEYDSTGSAKIIANYADDLPTVDTLGAQTTSRIVDIGASIIMSYQDIQASRFAGKSILERKIRAAAEVHMQTMNKLAFYGDVNYGVRGWLTNTSVDTQPVAPNTAPLPADAVTARLWENKTQEERVADLNEAVRYVFTTTNGIEQVDTIVLPIAQYDMLATEPYQQSGTDTTGLEFFTRNHPGITVTYAPELKGAFNRTVFNDPTSGVDGFIAYRRSDLKFWQEIPQAFQLFPEQWQNLAFTIPTMSSHGGTVIQRPASQVFRTGI